MLRSKYAHLVSSLPVDCEDGYAQQLTFAGFVVPSLVGGQAIEQRSSAHEGGMYGLYAQSPASATMHYSKGSDERSSSYSNGLVSNAPNAPMSSMMWPTTSTMGLSAGGAASTLPPLYPPSFTAMGSPILSSPPSSNASSMSAQSAAAHGLMVPPTVPSATFSNEHGPNLNGSLFDMHPAAALAGAKEESMADSRGYESFAGQSYETNAGAQLSAWTESTRPSAAASSSPTPPPASHPSSFQFGSWQQ